MWSSRDFFLLSILVVSLCFKYEAKELKLLGTYVESNNSEYVYQLPSNSNVPSGVLFLAHGCSHASTDWWPKSPGCNKCIGLPIERSIVMEGLRRNLMVIAVSASNPEHKCWSALDDKPVTEVINHIYTKFLGLNHSIPLYLLGASSGGTFVGRFPHSSHPLLPKIRATCVQISNFRNQSSVPVLFNLMAKDRHTLEGVRKHHPHSKLFVSPAQPIIPTYFSDHRAVKSAVDSETIQNALIGAGLLSHKLYLLGDPRRSEWRKVTGDLSSKVHALLSLS